METSTQSPINVSETVQTTEQIVDAAALAAQSIASATGLESLQALGAAIVAIHSRLDELEKAAPALQAMIDDVRSMIPDGFVSRVENFFGVHFPSHAAPATDVKSE